MRLFILCENMVVVVKVGGSILGEGVSPSIIRDIKSIYSVGGLVLVHGGGKEVTEIARKLGKEQKFVVSPEGIRSRYTDKETASIFTMVMSGLLGKQMTVALQKSGISAVGLSGVDGGLIRAQRKKKLIVMNESGRKMAVEGGYTGKVSEVNSGFLRVLLNNGYLPIISPVAMSEDFEFLNIDGDRAAAYVAGSLSADRVIFLTDVQGVLMDGKVVEGVTVSEARALQSKVGFGMEKKILAALEAIEMGVTEGIIASGLVENPISSAVSHKGCTVIKSD